MRRRQAQCAHVHTLSASAATSPASAGSGDRTRRSAVAPAAPRYSDDGVEGRAAGARIRYLWCVLLAFVVASLLGTTALGLWAAKRVKNTADFAVAGRHLPLVMIITTTFATWFGSETVLGIPAKFVRGGLNAVVEDPFGSSLCLVLVGLFFAGKLYRMTLLTISDYYRERFGRGVEVACSIVIILSYIGWVSAQVTALGIMFNLLSGDAISISLGMILGTISILAYTLFGGMWSVAVTDFVQMIVL